MLIHILHVMYNYILYAVMGIDNLFPGLAIPIPILYLFSYAILFPILNLNSLPFPFPILSVLPDPDIIYIFN